jgi:hypothetical protein
LRESMRAEGGKAARLAMVEARLGLASGVRVPGAWLALV